MNRSRFFFALSTLIAVYHLAVAGQIPAFLGYFVPHQIHKSISLFSALFLVFSLVPLTGLRYRPEAETERIERRIPWYDYLLIASAAVGAGYVVFFYESVLDYGEWGFMDTKGIVVSLMLVIPLLEALRRSIGWVLPIIILFFVSITLFQNYMPGLLYGRGYPLERLLYSTYVGNAGIFGLPLGIAANIVISFLIFGALMQGAGASQWFMDMAMALTGWSRGGPAKAAVVASAMFGSISGSPSGNAATTGVFTIPMMKKVGYTPAFAAAVEAVASTGGMILPPVMGAIAFIMAEWIGVTYVEVVAAATVPALLYFLIVFVSVHLQAQKSGIAPTKLADLPRFWATFSRGWYYLIPIVALIHFLVVQGRPPEMAAIMASGFVIACSFIPRDRSKWLTPYRIMVAFDQAVNRWVVIAVITAAVGIMIGALELSGVGIKFSRFIVELAQGDLLLTLLLVGAVSLIVGMGLDATPAYITLATLMAPALVRLGVPDIAAHLFVIYWGLASFYTPPTCIAVFITAGIANSKIWETGWEAIRLGIAAFLIPFAFVFNEGLLLRSDIGHIMLATLTAVAGSVLLACGIRGYALDHLGPVQRVLFMAGGLLFIAPGWVAPLAGLAVIAAAYSMRYLRPRVAEKS
ncbi:MAG: TRAP transporter fused permease subunit [Hyphomicrobiales bacterium]|nr:TRAP transporter fused permease subunit [Hyphomicrobiales bacterium]